MKQTDFRWLTKTVDQNNKVKVLQYRYKQKVTDYRIYVEDGYMTKEVWSEWIDIPEIEDNENVNS